MEYFSLLSLVVVEFVCFWKKFLSSYNTYTAKYLNHNCENSEFLLCIWVCTHSTPVRIKTSTAFPKTSLLSFSSQYILPLQREPPFGLLSRGRVFWFAFFLTSMKEFWIFSPFSSLKTWLALTGNETFKNLKLLDKQPYDIILVDKSLPTSLMNSFRQILGHRIVGVY